MPGSNGTLAVGIREREAPHTPAEREVSIPAYDADRFEQVGFLTAMTLTLLGNYAQTGHFGGPLAYTPYNIALHLAGPDAGGLRYDYRRPTTTAGIRMPIASCWPEATTSPPRTRCG